MLLWQTTNSVERSRIAFITTALTNQVGEKTAIDNKNNTKVGTKGAAISDDDFEAVTAPQMGTDFDTAWRNSDGSINTHGFMQVKESSALYSILGAKFQQIDTPPVVTTATTKQPRRPRPQRLLRKPPRICFGNYCFRSNL